MTATAAVVSAMAAVPAAAADGDVQVVNTETVQVYTSPTGEVETKRIYEQLALTGSGSVNLKNPVSTDGLRNLDGFGGFDVEDGNQITNMSVDGEEHLRSVSNFTGKLPLDVSVEYFLDGKRVEAGDVVGEDGKLEVKYVVKNVTGVDQELTFPDGKGGTVTKTVNVPIPMVGSLTTTAPENFTDVASSQANMAGDGEGATKLSFTMTLFPPIGSDTAEFGYTANITDGVVPRTSISALPVNPLESPTFSSAADSYQGGATTGIELTDGATQIDANLLKLRDGAGDLLAGLIKLRGGAQQLEAGLAGEAAPGANRLADGANQLNSGLGQINSGSQRLAAGTGEALAGGDELAAGLGDLKTGANDLSGGLSRLEAGGNALSAGFNSPIGAPDFVGGSADLVDGLALISGGISQLADASTGIPSAKSGAQALLAGVVRIRAGMSNPGCSLSNPSNPANPCGVLQGLQALRDGLNRSDPNDPGAILGASLIQDGLAQLLSTDVNHPGLPVAKGGVDQIRQGIIDALGAAGTVNQLVGGLQSVEARPGCASDPVCVGTVDSIITRVNSTTAGDGVDSLREQLSAADQGLGQVSAGLDGAITGVNALSVGSADLKAGLVEAEGGVGNLIGGVGLIQAGLSNSNCDPKNPTNPANPCGLTEGLTALVSGLTTASAGLVEQLAPGAKQALSGASKLSGKLVVAGAGAQQLADGLGTANSGSNKLAAGAGKAAAGGDALANGLGEVDDGANKLADGAGEAEDGSSQVAEGADQLSDGLTDAADGSGQLAGGLDKAAGGAPKLRDGAQRLSDEGTTKLIEAGDSTAQTYGELYATMNAGAERADAEQMVFGAPAGAVGLAAYSYEINGDDGEGSRNLARGLGGLTILALGAGAFALRRRVA